MQTTSKDPPGSPMAHTRAILSYGPRPAASPSLHKVRAYVTEELRKSGWTVGAQTFDAQTPFGPKSFTNLIARFSNKDEKDLWTKSVKGLLCAHLDSKFYPDKRFLGADDAASACGLLLTLAEDLSKEPQKASQTEIIFFDGEEAFGESITMHDGLYGSKAYAGRWRGITNKPTFGILLDMVGHKDLSIKAPSDSPPQLLKLMIAAAEKTGNSAYFGVRDTPVIDDHVPLNQVGIPTIDLIGDFTNSHWWHTERDNIGILSAESLEITRQVVNEMIQNLLEKS